VKTLQAVTILGSTGTIGVNTLKVIGMHPDLYRVHAITANTSTDLLLTQCLECNPDFAVIGSAADANQLQKALQLAGSNTEVLWGEEGLVRVASARTTDIVMAAIVGGIGLVPTLAAAEAGKKVLLANKEALVMAGELFMRAARDNGAAILPIDSEHNAIFQCLPVDDRGRFRDLDEDGVATMVLTASGGPFRDLPLELLAGVTPDQACAHPNWVMGRKISVDSASMVNKVLELIEASYLFGIDPDRIDILLHPQSIVHSMVTYRDGSVLAQLGNPDMRTPIAYGLAWPHRIAAGVTALDLIAAGKLEFSPLDPQRFPVLPLGRAVAKARGSAPVIFNAANEIAVAGFLAGQVGFTQIPVIIDRVLQDLDLPTPVTLEDILQTDQRARARARELMQ
jgi:1-deoxy-D-xylulose-5-phosphate reductoisomerase